MKNIEGLKKRKSFTKNDPRINRKGRPPKLPELDVLLAKVLDSEKEGNLTGTEKILRAIKRRAEKGDVRAAELILNRGYGKPKESVDLNFKDATERQITLPGGTTIQT